jgi:hypothetical protein
MTDDEQKIADAVIFRRLVALCGVLELSIGVELWL